MKFDQNGLYLVECRSIRDAEMNFILDNLRIRKKFCTMEWLNSKGMIAKDTGSDDMFHTLSFAFAETPLAMKQIIRDEIVSLFFLVILKIHIRCLISFNSNF